MKQDYESEAERQAYAKGVFAAINGLDKKDCPYHLPHNVKCWIEGFNEKASIKECIK